VKKNCQRIGEKAPPEGRRLAGAGVRKTQCKAGKRSIRAKNAKKGVGSILGGKSTLFEKKGSRAKRQKATGLERVFSRNRKRKNK